MDKKTITTRQFMIFYILLLLSPTIRIFPRYVVEKANGYAYLSIIAGALFSLLLIFMFANISKKRQGENLSEIILDVFSRPIGKIMLIPYFLWTLLLFAMFFRFYSDQISISLLTNCRIEFIIFTMAIFVYFTIKNGILATARMNEILFYIMVTMFVVMTLFTITPNFNYRNFEYLSGINYKSIFEGSFFSYTVFSYIVFMFFFFDKVKPKKDLRRLGTKAVSYSAVFGVMTIMATVGILGVGATTHLSMPYFSVIKNISILSFERFEALTYSIWIIGDYVAIYVCAYSCVSIFQAIFNLKSKKGFVAPILLLGVSLSLFLAESSFLMDNVVSKYVFPITVILTTSILPLVLIVGKIRKKI